MKRVITYSIFWMVLLAGAENTMASAADTLTVKVTGFHEDSRFEPSDLTISAGDVIRFNVVEGIHTVTAYHPDNRKPLRIPERAESFDSGPLQAGDEWHLQIKVPGEYNYFCLPHERFGHVGKINAL
ncbi:MAG: plastocyanin/azurin family copper-binding protein [Balneolaceae bacterium]